MAPEYAFLTHWRVRGTAQEVFDVLADPLGLARWWPSAYLEVKELVPADPQTHAGRVIGLVTKGWLPYILRPIFAGNHRWAMARGLESLGLELRRRRGEAVPALPGPTFARP